MEIDKFGKMHDNYIKASDKAYKEFPMKLAKQNEIEKWEDNVILSTLFFALGFLLGLFILFCIGYLIK